MPLGHYHRLLKLFCVGAVALISLILWRYSPRFIALPFLFTSCILGALWAVTGRWKWLLLTLAMYIGTTLNPIDIRPTHWFGRPRMVPVVMGLPRKEAFEAAKRGEVWLGGCIVHGKDPKWMIIW